MKDVILYHGSREGIKGNIQPVSRERCDFGKGFYMGTDKYQAQSLILKGNNPTLYTIKFKLSEIPENKILALSGEDWLYAVLSSRKETKKFDQLDLAKYWVKNLSKYDVIIGKIADDSMSAAIERFINSGITDKGLLACLSEIDLGVQYVAKTKFACEKIEIISEKNIKGIEIQYAHQYLNQIRAKNIEIVDRMAEKYASQGKRFERISKEEKEKKGGVGNA